MCVLCFILYLGSLNGFQPAATSSEGVRHLSMQTSRLGSALVSKKLNGVYLWVSSTVFVSLSGPIVNDCSFRSSETFIIFQAGIATLEPTCSILSCW